jgi:hypothetical protein
MIKVRHVTRSVIGAIVTVIARTSGVKIPSILQKKVKIGYI